MTRFMPRRCPSSQNMWEANCGPLSEMALSGDPYCLYSESRSRVAVPVVSMVLLQGMKIAPFEDPWSTTAIIES